MLGIRQAVVGAGDDADVARLGGLRVQVHAVLDGDEVVGLRLDDEMPRHAANVLKASEKRPIPPKRLEELVTRIESRLHQTEEREISTSDIGNLVMDELRELDPVAFVRFASVYRKFEDIGAFVEEVQNLLKKPVA